MTETAVRVDGLGKRYRIGGPPAGYRTLRETVTDAAAAPYRKLRAVLAGEAARAATETIWALRDVSFEVPAGQVVGIIGPNGAGKTTLLKILSRITEPTSGRAETSGRLGALLEVGTGFHQELTGRENIHLNAAILGLRRGELERRFDDIVAFSEIDRFLDTPVKYYSSGMYVRLAFAVAAHLDPDILVVDEVLSVGDAAFQKKCLGKMDEVAHGGRTVLFVSHNLSSVTGLCQRAIWLDGGRVALDGDARTVVNRYLASVNETQLNLVSRGGEGAPRMAIDRVVLRNGDGLPTTTFDFGDDIMIEIHYRADDVIRRPFLWIDVSTQQGGLFAASMLFDDLRPEIVEGAGTIACTFRNVRLFPRTEPFTVHLGILDQHRRYIIPPSPVSAFHVRGNARDLGIPGDHADAFFSLLGPIAAPYEWRFPDGDVRSPAWSK